MTSFTTSLTSVAPLAASTAPFAASSAPLVASLAALTAYSFFKCKNWSKYSLGGLNPDKGHKIC